MQNDKNQKEKSGFKINKGLYFIDVDKFANKTPSDLWNDKTRKSFFAWIYAFLSIVVVLNIMAILQITFWVLDKDSIIKSFEIVHEQNPNFVPEYNWRIELVSLILSFGIQGFMLFSLSRSIYKCTKNKSFKFISFLPTMFVFIQAIYSFIDIFKFAILGLNIVDSFKTSWVYAFKFALLFAYILIWFFISRNVSLIRNIAMQIEMRSAINNRFAEQNGEINFGEKSFENNNAEDVDKNDPFYTRLKSLSRSQINEMAKSLAISGYEAMTDEELINIMKNIKDTQSNETKETIVEIEKENDNENKEIN